MKLSTQTRGLWLRARYREGQFEGEACLLAYDAEAFSDFLLSMDIKEVFERRASTANIFIAVPFLSGQQCRNALISGAGVKRAIRYLSGKSGNVYLIELQPLVGIDELALTVCAVTWNEVTGKVDFGDSKPLDASLREGWLFDLFDSNDGLVIAPPGVHFRKTSRKHTTTFLRAANALTCSVGCGILALFSLSQLGRLKPKRLLVDTAPLLSLAFALMRVAKTHGIWQEDVPAKSFSSYGGLTEVGRLSPSDVILVSATTSGSISRDLVSQGARAQSVVTLYFLGEKDTARPTGVLCDLTTAGNKSFGYQPVVNFPANDCKLCDSEYLLAEFEGDQFLLQQRQHRLLRILKKTQSSEARKVLAELCGSNNFEVVLRAGYEYPNPVAADEEKLLCSKVVRDDYIRLMRRYCPQPLTLVVRVNMSEVLLKGLAEEAGMAATFASATIIDWSKLPSLDTVTAGAGVLVVFGFLASHTQARSINASLRAVVDGGNVAYLSALTFANTPEQYQDLQMFLGYGERGLETFTFRSARRLALPNAFNLSNAWQAEQNLLDRLADPSTFQELEDRRNFLGSAEKARNDIFLAGKKGSLAIQPDFVYLDTSKGTSDFTQADIFTVMLNLLSVARSVDRELATKAASPGEMIELTQSVYGHVLIAPAIFSNYNDAVLKACLLRGAHPSELMYEVDGLYSSQIAEIVLAELKAWGAGTGEALPEMLLALATERMRLREVDRLSIRKEALAAKLPPLLDALAHAIPT